MVIQELRHRPGANAPVMPFGRQAAVRLGGDSRAIMTIKLNVLHLLVALGATGCAGVLLREARGRLVRPSRLLAAPLLAAIAALFLLALVAPEDREPKLWALALATGAASGALRGLAMNIQVDHTWSLIRLPSGRDGLWTGAALAGLAMLTVVLGFTDADTGAYEALGAAAAAAMAGYLGGRALALYLRTARAPHRDLGRRLLHP
jgi:hypothetical protein